MTPHAARAKLNYAVKLFGAANVDQIVDFMTKNDFVGEQAYGFTRFSANEIRDAELLRSRLYEMKEIKPLMVEKFESEEFKVEFAVSEVREMLALTVDSDESRIAATDLRAQYTFYKSVKDLGVEALIELIKVCRDVATVLGDRFDDDLIKNVSRAANISTVRPKGFPIQLEKVT